MPGAPKRQAPKTRGKKKNLYYKNKRQQNNKPKANQATKANKTQPNKKKVISAVDKAKKDLKQQSVEILKVASLNRTVSLLALYRNVHANVLSIVKNLSPTAIGNITAKPVRSPAGIAWYLYWAFVDYVRENGNAVDGVPDYDTLPKFGRHNNVPIAFLVFCQSFIRNRTKTIDINAEFGDLRTLFSGAVTAGTAYNATHTQYASAYGAVYSPNSTNVSLEWQFPVTATTFTQAQAVAEADVLSDMVGKAVGCMPFDSLLSTDNDGGIRGGNKPVLCAFPTTNGFSSAYPVDREMAYLVIDTSSANNVTGVGPVYEPYPGVSQDLFVLNAVNLLNHMSPPACDFHGKVQMKFPRDVKKIICPGRGSHQWHGFGKIRSLIVNQSADSSAWIGLNRLIAAIVSCTHGSTDNTGNPNSAALVNQALVIQMCFQAYCFAHCIDWGWTKYTVPNGLDTTIYVNAITTVASSSFKDLNVPSLILDWARQLAYPIVINGKLTLPSMPKVARSTLANWAGLQVAYVNQSSLDWEAVAAPNGYGSLVDKSGLFTSVLYNAGNISPTITFKVGGSAAFNLDATNAFGTITATNQSPTVPIRLAKQFLLYYDTYFVNNAASLANFNISFPHMGGVAYHSYINAFQRVLNFDNGWACFEWDIVDMQNALAVDRPTFWRAADNARTWNLLATADANPNQVYPFRASVISPDTGLGELVSGMKNNNGGLQYQSILTGLESADRGGKLEFKNLIALDHVVDQIHANREGPSFIKSDALNGLRLYALANKDLKCNMTSIVYVGKGDGTLFQPRSLSAFLAFLQGATGVLRTVSNITGKVAGWLDSALGLKTVTAV